MKRYISVSYNSDLEDEVNYYQSVYTTGELTADVLEEIWNDVYDRYADESLADDVVEALDYGSLYL